MSTQIGYGPLARIDGPPPIPPIRGLLPAAEAPAAGVRIIPDAGESGTERWIGGAEVFPYPPDLGGLFDTCAPGSATAGMKDFGDEDIPSPQFGAITAYLAETCTSSRVWNQQEYKARALVALAAVESALVARQLMIGEGLALNPHLADGNATILNSGASTSPGNALALLEEAIGLTERMGLIHCSPQMATLLKENFAIDEKGGVIRTINGNVVVPDAGYTAAALVSPEGEAPVGATEEWMYATGPVDIRRSAPFVNPENVSEALDRGMGATNQRTNSITYRAERYYLVDWDTVLQAAALVDRCQTIC